MNARSRLPLTAPQQLAIIEESRREGGAYHLACDDGGEAVSLRELDDLRQRGLLDENFHLTPAGREEWQRIDAQLRLTPKEAAIVIRAMEYAKNRLAADGLGPLGDVLFIRLAFQHRHYMRQHPDEAREIIDMMDPPEAMRSA
jgi:hypothetical protein